MNRFKIDKSTVISMVFMGLGLVLIGIIRGQADEFLERFVQGLIAGYIACIIYPKFKFKSKGEKSDVSVEDTEKRGQVKMSEGDSS